MSADTPCLRCGLLPTAHPSECPWNSPRFIVRVRVPEAAGLTGAGSLVPGSDKPRSDLGLTLRLPRTTSTGGTDA